VPLLIKTIFIVKHGAGIHEDAVAGFYQEFAHWKDPETCCQQALRNSLRYRTRAVLRLSADRSPGRLICTADHLCWRNPRIGGQDIRPLASRMVAWAWSLIRFRRLQSAAWRQETPTRKRRRPVHDLWDRLQARGNVSRLPCAGRLDSMPAAAPEPRPFACSHRLAAGRIPPLNRPAPSNCLVNVWACQEFQGDMLYSQVAIGLVSTDTEGLWTVLKW